MKKWEFYRSETLGEEEKRHKELIEKSEIVKEIKEKNRRMMKTPDGRILMTHITWTPKPSLYGVALMADGEVNDEEIQEAKELVLDKICETIRDVAKRKPDEFFIIHTPSSDNPLAEATTVGAKFILPTVLDDEEAIGRG